MAHSGYDKERFVNMVFDNFDCLICCEIVMDPLECEVCGKLFCKVCIGDWIRKNPTVKCPNRCTSQITPIKSMALKKLYNNLDIRCSNAKCNKTVKLIDLHVHEDVCLKVKCWNFENCEKIENESYKYKKPVCSSICQVLGKLQESYGNKKRMYEILGQITNSKIKQTATSSTIEVLCWDTSKFGTGIIVSDSNTHVFLKQQPYVFRSVMGNIGFTEGVNYWEIIADPRTQNQIKIGITSSKDFDHNSAFCDHGFGYAYYGLGQLRHGSNATGPAYGKRFKKEGILGICLNMHKGTLSFALNGEFMGVAFQDEKLKNGKYFPAVSLLHCAGCKIRGGIPLPSCFN